jgi:hypothetical protein
MQNIKLLLVLTGLSILPVSGQASLAIKLDDGVNQLTIADNALQDTVSQLGAESILQPFDNWIVNVVSSTNLGSTTSSPSLNLTSFNISYNGTGPALPLKIYLTDTGYGPTPGYFDLHIGGTQQNSLATIVSKFYYDTGNHIFTESNQIGATQTFNTASYSNDQVAVGPGGVIAAPYSLTIEADIFNVPTGIFTSQFTSTLKAAPVPVPPALTMLLSGLGFMGLFGKRNKKAA